MFGGNFAPRSWAFCDGQLLPISQNTALFSLLGTIYGGDGRTTFALPDLRGRIALHAGTGPGLPTYKPGQKGGRNSITLGANNVPAHNHTATLHSEGKQADKANPTNRMLAGSKIFADIDAADDVAMAPGSIVVNNNTGGGQAFDSMNPYTAVNHIIALQGIYPSRS